jgi:hypothetical protein
MATGLMAVPLAGTEPGAALPTVALGPHRVTRLIAGSNPLYGYSHFNRLLNQLMAEYFTDERKKEIGVIPVGETYLSTDPPRMCEMIRRTRKPCLGFKILAAGRRCGAPEDVRKAFEFAFQNIKPSDGVIVGMYPRYTDQIGENVGLVRELAV